MELVFQTDRKTVKWPNGLLILGVIIIQLLGVCDGSFKENLVKTVQLYPSAVALTAWVTGTLRVGGPAQLDGKKLSRLPQLSIGPKQCT